MPVGATVKSPGYPGFFSLRLSKLSDACACFALKSPHAHFLCVAPSGATQVPLSADELSDLDTLAQRIACTAPGYNESQLQDVND
jgi:hypothetical protein